MEICCRSLPDGRVPAGESRAAPPPYGGKNVSEHHDSIYENTQYPPREHQERPRRRRHRSSPAAAVLKVLGTLLLVGLVTGAFLCCFGAVYIKTVIIPIAQEFTMNDFDVGENSVMYYQDKSTGEYKELVTLLNTTSSIWVDSDEIPKYLKEAAVAVEDKRFYTHPGVDWVRTGKAVLCMFTGQDIQGGSTITQQLIKNLTGYNETTVKRKVVEIFRALEFTKKYSKDYTLEWYLNIIPMGGKYKGVGSASYYYFGKPVSELSLAECASLISITNNPSMYSPYSTARFEDPDTGEDPHRPGQEQAAAGAGALADEGPGQDQSGGVRSGRGRGAELRPGRGRAPRRPTSTPGTRSRSSPT